MEYYQKACSVASEPKKNKSNSDLEVLDLLKNCELFCVYPQDSSTTFTEEVEHNPNGYEGELDSPFRTIWVEMGELNGSKYKVTVDYNQYKFHEPIVNCLGLLIHETSPKIFRIWGLIETYGMFDDYDKRKILFLESSSWAGVAKSLIQRINKETWGLENPKIKLKIGSGDLKSIKRIKSIIHITPKRNTKTVSTESKRIINWSHAWTVRGHWRKVSGIGKDRDGIESVKGHTWIKSYIKGDGELVKKSRIVK
jgi:hypothetical protein